MVKVKLGENTVAEVLKFTLVKIGVVAVPPVLGAIAPTAPVPLMVKDDKLVSVKLVIVVIPVPV